jgi:hypothetical protein
MGGWTGIGKDIILWDGKIQISGTPSENMDLITKGYADGSNGYLKLDGSNANTTIALGGIEPTQGILASWLGGLNLYLYTAGYDDYGSLTYSLSGGDGIFTFVGVGNDTVKATSFTIGANKLTTLEFGYLDGQDQSVKTTSSPTFDDLTIGGIVTSYYGLSTDGIGVPVIVDVVRLTNQSANIGATGLVGTNSTGMYEINVVLECTTGAAGAALCQCTLAYTDDAGATTTLINRTMTAAGRTTNTTPIYNASGNAITYALSDGTWSTSIAALNIVVKKLS